MKNKCQICGEIKSLNIMRLFFYDEPVERKGFKDGTIRLECLMCHAGIPQEMEDQFLQCGQAIMDGADKIRKQMDRL